MIKQPKPVYQVTTFTDMQRDVLQFDEVGADPPKRILRGSRKLQLDPQTPPTLVVFDFDEKTVLDCFKAYDSQWEKIRAQVQAKVAAQGRVGGIIPATRMPVMPPPRKK